MGARKSTMHMHTPHDIAMTQELGLEAPNLGGVNKAAKVKHDGMRVARLPAFSECVRIAVQRLYQGNKECPWIANALTRMHLVCFMTLCPHLPGRGVRCLCQHWSKLPLA